jgi:hypothetical protein
VRCGDLDSQAGGKLILNLSPNGVNAGFEILGGLGHDDQDVNISSLASWRASWLLAHDLHRDQVRPEEAEEPMSQVPGRYATDSLNLTEHGVGSPFVPATSIDAVS